MATLEQPTAAAPPRRRLGLGAMVLLSVLALLLLLLAAFAAGAFISARQLQAELDKIRAAGEPVTTADLDAFYAYPPKDRDTTELWLDAFAVLDSPSFASDAKPLPIVGEVDGPGLPGEPWPQLDAAEAFLAKYRKPLEKMHRAAELGSETRFPVKFSSAGAASLLPRIQQTRAAARLLTLEAEVHARRGEAHAAARSVRAILALARSLDREPLLVSQLVRIAINGIACEQIERFLPAIEFSQADLIEFERLLAAIDDEAGFRRTLLAERAILISEFENRATFYHSLLLSGDETAFLQVMAKYVDASRSAALPLREAIEQTDEEVANFLKPRIAQWRFPITSLLAPSFRPACDAICSAQARQATARTAIAIELYRGAHGEAPDTLDRLAPGFLEQPPVDPFDGAPLRYHRDAAGYKVYSIGPDGIDQGGKSGEEGQELGIVFEVPFDGRNRN